MAMVPSKPLATLTSLPAIAIGASTGMVLAGVLAVIAGSYAHAVVHDQLAPQKIRFAPAGTSQLPRQIERYANRQVLDGATAKVFADQYIAVYLKELGHGRTYTQVSQEALAEPSNAALAKESQTLFQGEALRGLLLQAWGWGEVGTIALIAGWVLIVLGLALLLPLLLSLLINRLRAASSPRGVPAEGGV